MHNKWQYEVRKAKFTNALCAYQDDFQPAFQGSYYYLDDFATYKILYALHAYQDATPDVSVAHYCMPWSSVRMYALVTVMHQAKRMF